MSCVDYGRDGRVKTSAFGCDFLFQLLLSFSCPPVISRRYGTVKWSGKYKALYNDEGLRRRYGWPLNVKREFEKTFRERPRQ